MPLFELERMEKNLSVVYFSSDSVVREFLVHVFENGAAFNENINKQKQNFLFFIICHLYLLFLKKEKKKIILLKNVNAQYCASINMNLNKK